MDTIESLPLGLTTADLPLDMQAAGRVPEPRVREHAAPRVLAPHTLCEHGWTSCEDCLPLGATYTG